MAKQRGNFRVTVQMASDSAQRGVTFPRDFFLCRWKPS